ncbi:MAG: endonuclease III [Candidatus Hadarchaeales archaeon]
MLILKRLNLALHLFEASGGSPFQILVETVLSQNTTSKNAARAYVRLMSRFRTPEDLARAKLSDIMRLIMPSGMYRSKSKHLKRMSRMIVEKYGGDLKKVLRMPYPLAREELTSLPGVGKKTADVVLAFAAGRDVLPVDTHVFRVSKRLGFAAENDGYEEVKEKLERITPEGKRRLAHVLLIQLGRTYCRARKPDHERCPVRDLCPSA